MKSPFNASSAPVSAPRDTYTAELSRLSSHVTTLNEQATETLEKLSTLISDVACIKERLELVHGAIERLERSIMAQGIWDPNCTSHDQPSIPQAATNLNQSIQGASSPRRHQSGCRTPISIASPPTYLNASPIKTPQQIVEDLASISGKGTFYIVTKGREPGIYTNWPKTEAIVRGLGHPVYCKKYSKGDAIDVYRDAYEENRLECIWK